MAAIWSKFSPTLIRRKGMPAAWNKAVLTLSASDGFLGLCEAPSSSIAMMGRPPSVVMR